MTTENLLFLSLQVFSSGIAGYITNKYAVNMIFKEYTPLKIGGAVKKNKEKFIEEISDLVEKDIINSSTIKDNILSEEFKDTMKDATDDFIIKSLSDVFEDFKIEEIIGVEATLNNSKELIRRDGGEIISKFFNNIINHVKVEDILSEKQIEHIGNYIYKEIDNVIGEDENIKKLIFDLYNEQKNICLNEIVSKETADKITRIISCEIVNAIDEILEDKKETKQLVDNVLSLMDIKSIMKDLQKSFGSKTIEDIVSEEGIDKLSVVIHKSIDDMIKSSEGNDKLDQFIDESILSMEKIDLTIFEILPIHFGRTSSEYLVKILKDISPYFINWIEDNKIKIEKIIDDSIIESIDNIDDDLRKSMISKVKDTILVDFASRNKIVDKINEFIYSYVNNDEVSTEVYEKIIKFLEETKVSDLVRILEENNLLNRENIKQIILTKWEESGQQVSRDLIKKQCSKTLNGVLGQDFYRLFNKLIKPNLYELLNTNKEKIICFLDKSIFNLVHSKVDNILDKKIGDLLEENKVVKISKIFPDKLSKYINSNSVVYRKEITKTITNLVKEVDLNTYIKENENKIIDKSKEEVIKFIEIIFEKYKCYEVKDVVKSIGGNDEFTNFVSDKVYKNVVNNLPQIVDGNVKKVIYDNLIKLDEEEICDIAQSFMGKQLKPLSMFGAFLGGIVGLVFGLLLQNINGNYGFYNNIQNTMIACLILGGVGIMTNVIALWMIFCPYEKNKFIAKIPVFRIFSIGYIPSHKDSFANGMAYFIDNELLSGSRLSNLFKSKKEHLKSSIIEKLATKNNFSVEHLIKTNQSILSTNIYKLLLNVVNKNKAYISKYLADNILQIESEKIVSYNKIKKNILIYANRLNNYEDKIVNYLEEKLKLNKSIEELISQELMESINDRINNEIKSLTNKSIENEYVEKLLKSYVLDNSQMFNNFTNKILDDVINYKIFISIEKNLKSDKTINLLLIQLKLALNNHISAYIENELPDDKRLDELFDGKIKNTINRDIYKLTESAIDVISAYCEKNQQTISNLVIKTVRNNLNFFVKMAYDFADGDGLVNDVIYNIINNKLKPLLIEEKSNISIIMYNSLERHVYETKITDLGITPKEINTNLLLDRFVYGLKQDDNFMNSIYSTNDLIIENVKKVKIKDITDSFGIETIEKAYYKCQPFVKSLEENIVQNLRMNKIEVDDFIYNIVNNKMMNKLYRISLVEISWEINESDIKYTVNKVLSILDKSEVIDGHMMNIFENVYNSSIKSASNLDVLNGAILNEDINYSFGKLLENRDFNEVNKDILHDLFSIITKDELEFINKDSKIFIRDKFIDAGLETSEKYIMPLLKTIDLKDITVKEIEHMHPKEIHILFKSFAGDFFKKLYLYGGVGFIFGINLYLSIILLIIDMIYTKQTENKKMNKVNNLFKEN